MPLSDDDRLDKTPTRRISDVQMGIIIERVRNIEQHVIDLGEKFDHWTNRFEEQCNKRHSDVSKMTIDVSNKASKEQLDQLRDVVQNHTTYWGLFIGTATLGSSIVYMIFKLLQH